jgi:hypothetical protein
MDREMTETFLIQADIYCEERDEDLLEMRETDSKLRQESSDNPAMEEDVDNPPGVHETHLAAIYEEVAELRHQVSLSFILHLCYQG